MIPPLVRLPATALDHDGLQPLADAVARLSSAALVCVSAQRAGSGAVLDEFVVAAWLAAHGSRVGVAARVGAGRAASVVAREATAAQLLGACDALLLEGDVATCRDAAVIVAALFTEGAHTVATSTSSIVSARNLPLPDVAGGPPVCWREGDVLVGFAAGTPTALGAALDAPASSRRPDAALVALELPVAPPSELLAALTA